MTSWKVLRSTFRAGLTASDTREATMRLMFFSLAMSTMRWVIMPSKTSVSTPVICWSFSAS